jgi:predicted transposase/invertase (TIGR01784 family)
MEKYYIRFDWAVKKLLRQKANHVVLEGFLTVLLKEKIKIINLLESESNQESSDDKFNRVDMLAENEKGELLIIEVQNTREVAYFHRMIYGTSKVISKRMKLGNEYDKVKKVYSINIVYFELGHGKDYVYHGKTEFRSLHNPDEILQLTASQKKQFQKESVGDVFPEYYVIRVAEFDKIAVDPLDEWISFLKTSQIPDSATAPGLADAKKIMALNTMSDEEIKIYERHIDNLRYQRSVLETQRIEGREEGHAEGFVFGLEEGRAEGRARGRVEGRTEGKAEGREVEKIEIAQKAKVLGLSIEQIKELTDLSVEEIEKL